MKPRLDVKNGIWRCRAGTTWAYGKTPLAAYEDYKQFAAWDSYVFSHERPFMRRILDAIFK